MRYLKTIAEMLLAACIVALALFIGFFGSIIFAVFAGILAVGIVIIFIGFAIREISNSDNDNPK